MQLISDWAGTPNTVLVFSKHDESTPPWIDGPVKCSDRWLLYTTLRLIKEDVFARQEDPASPAIKHSSGIIFTVA